MIEESAPKKSKFSVPKKVDYRVVCAVLLVIILLLVVLWRPWVKAIAANSRTVTVTGTASVKSTPDQFVFYPTYTAKATDNQAAITELSKKSDELVAKLKALGVSEDDIKTNSSSYDGKYMMTTMYPMPESSNTLQLTVTVDTREQAQKVQDYLITTGATGSTSPQATFSTAKQKALQAQARDEASKDAKAQANQLAKNLGFKLGAVKAVEDQAGFGGGVMPMSVNANDAGGREVTTMSAPTTTITGSAGASGSVAISSGDVKTAQLAVMPGQDEVYYSVNVTYFLK